MAEDLLDDEAALLRATVSRLEQVLDERQELVDRVSLMVPAPIDGEGTAAAHWALVRTHLHELTREHTRLRDGLRDLADPDGASRPVGRRSVTRRWAARATEVLATLGTRRRPTR